MDDRILNVNGKTTHCYEKPSIVSEDLPSQLSIGQCSLDPDVHGCSLTTNYAANPSWETGFPGFCHF